jgi:phosphatidylglycerophosphate synthase
MVLLCFFSCFSQTSWTAIWRENSVFSDFGTYFDVTADFIFVFSMFLVFGSAGFYADWVLIVIAAVFAQFVLTSRFSNKIHDPVGKYYGSLLYAAIGLRFIFSGELFYYVVTASIVAFSVASILSWANSILKKDCYSFQIDFLRVIQQKGAPQKSSPIAEEEILPQINLNRSFSASSIIS